MNSTVEDEHSAVSDSFLKCVNPGEVIISENNLILKETWCHGTGTARSRDCGGSLS